MRKRNEKTIIFVSNEIIMILVHRNFYIKGEKKVTKGLKFETYMNSIRHYEMGAKKVQVVQEDRRRKQVSHVTLNKSPTEGRGARPPVTFGSCCKSGKFCSRDLTSFLT